MTSPIDLNVQAKVTAVLRAAREAGYENVALEIQIDSSIRASFSVTRPTPEAPPAPDPAPEMNTLPVPDRWLTEEEKHVGDLWASLKIRERLAMDYMFDHRGQRIAYEAIKGASSNTQYALEAKGWMKRGDDMSWHLLPEGERICRIVRTLPGPV